MTQPSRPDPTTTTDTSPPPHLRVCVALFRWTCGHLEAAFMDGGILPFTAPSAEEALDETAVRFIRETTGVDAQYLEQLYTFSPSQGAPRQIVISYLALFPTDTPTSGAVQGLSWQPIGDIVLEDELDRMVLEYALVRLRAKLGYTNIAFYLLPETFTLTELQQTYEIILDQPMDKRNFRRRMIASGILSDTGEKRREGSHRPATLYRFRPDADQSSYLTPRSQAPARPEAEQEGE